MNDLSNEPKLTFRRFTEGETEDDWDLEEKIFQADQTHKCPTYVHKTPPCQGSCPSGHEIRGWLAIARGMDKPPVEDMAWQEYAFQRMVAANPFSRHHGPGLPRALRSGLQPQRGRRLRGHQRGRAIRGRLGQRERRQDGSAWRRHRQISCNHWRRPGGPVGGLFSAARRPRSHAVRGA